MKLLVIASSLDLRLPYSCTPAWWQLLKGLAEIGVDIAAVAYAGETVESLWWKAYDNPCRVEGDAFAMARGLMRRVTRPSPPYPPLPDAGEGGEADASFAPSPLMVENATPQHVGGLPSPASGRGAGGEGREGVADRLTREVAHRWVMPRWRAHLDGIIRKDGPFDAVLMLTAPLNHLAGLPGYLRRRHSLPVFYYDGDLPASLPRFQGFQSGFRIYQGANLQEYDGFIANSKGGAEELRALGAPNVHVLYYGADPDVFAPQRVEQDIDAFFYGHGAEYREGWIRDMLAAPSERLPDLDFAMRGSGFGTPLGRVRALPYLSVAKLREYCCRSRLNLVITRQAHASVYASSTARPFELAAMGATMISNPYLGIEEWFEPGKEVIVVHSQEEAIERYRWLIDHDTERHAIGERARQRLLAEHTFTHRAQQLVSIMQGKDAA